MSLKNDWDEPDNFLFQLLIKRVFQSSIKCDEMSLLFSFLKKSTILSNSFLRNQGVCCKGVCQNLPFRLQVPVPYTSSHFWACISPSLSHSLPLKGGLKKLRLLIASRASRYINLAARRRKLQRGGSFAASDHTGRVISAQQLALDSKTKKRAEF